MQRSVVIVHNTAPIFVRLGDPIALTQIVFLRLAVRVEVRLFGPYSNTHSMSAMRCEAV
jgi:hypothetical protein